MTHEPIEGLDEALEIYAVSPNTAQKEYLKIIGIIRFRA